MNNTNDRLKPTKHDDGTLSWNTSRKTEWQKFIEKEKELDKILYSGYSLDDAESEPYEYDIKEVI